MSRIDELVRELCPNGVEYKTLADAGSVVRGKRFVKDDMIDAGVPCVHYGEIYTKYGISAAESISYVSEERARTLRFAQPGDVIMASAGETVEDIGKSIAWLGNEPIAIHDACYAFSSSMDPKFVSYFFASRSFRDQIRRNISSSKISSISTQNVAKVRIPVPPLEVQREIVRVLDTFTQLEAQLEAELEAELEARRAQYEFYRGVILSGTSSGDGGPVVKLKDVADLLVGYAFKSKEFSADQTDMRLLRGDNIGQGRLKDHDFKRWSRRAGDRLDRYELAEGDVVLAMDRPWIPAGLKWAIVSVESLPALLVQRVARLRGHAGVLHQGFLARLIGSPAFTQHVLNVQTGNTVPHISGASIGEFCFSLPPVEEQIRLATQVDAFDGLVHDLSIGLPAELSARRKQYDYYRDRLLTFKELAA